MIPTLRMDIGYHTSTSSLTGVRAHTMSSALLTRIAVNGVAQSEAGINAVIAAHFGVPVVMITTESSEEHVKEAIVAGAQGYIRKPFTAEQVKDRVLPLLDLA